MTLASQGIDILATDGVRVHEFAWVDSSSNPVTTGTATYKIAEVQSDGTLKYFEFDAGINQYTFIVGGTDSASLTHAGDGIWTAVVPSLTGFSEKGTYILIATHSVQGTQYRKFQHGGAHGDMQVTNLGVPTGKALKVDVVGIDNAISPAAAIADAVLDEAKGSHSGVLATVAQTGADGDTLETLSDQIDSIPTTAAPTAAAIDTQLSGVHGSGSWVKGTTSITTENMNVSLEE